MFSDINFFAATGRNAAFLAIIGQSGNCPVYRFPLSPYRNDPEIVKCHATRRRPDTLLIYDTKTLVYTLLHSFVNEWRLLECTIYIFNLTRPKIKKGNVFRIIPLPVSMSVFDSQFSPKLVNKSIDIPKPEL